MLEEIEVPATSVTTSFNSCVARGADDRFLTRPSIGTIDYSPSLSPPPPQQYERVMIELNVELPYPKYYHYLY